MPVSSLKLLKACCSAQLSALVMRLSLCSPNGTTATRMAIADSIRIKYSLRDVIPPLWCA